MKSRLYGFLVLVMLALMIVGPVSSLVYAAGKQAKADTNDYRWKGLYAGLHAGYGWGDGDTQVNPLPTPAIFADLAPTIRELNSNGTIAGGQVGYNWQSEGLVLGVETDYSWSGMSGTKVESPIIRNNGAKFPGAGNALTTHQDTDWFGTLRLRIGCTPVSKLLIYGTGGMAYGRVNYSVNTNFLPIGSEQYAASLSKTKVGWTAGAGAEYAINERWSIKAEYLYYDLGDQSATTNPSIPFGIGAPNYQVNYKWETRASTINVGLNYRF